MKKIWPGSSFVRIFLPSAALVTVIFLLLGWLFIRGESALNLAKEEETVKMAASILSKEIGNLVSDLGVISSHSELRNWLENGEQASLEELKGELLGFIRGKKVYDQVRLIDTKGDEIIRINYNNGKAAPVPATGLQNKSQRPYFRNTLFREPGDIYISPLDLNREFGEIEKPYKPVIRIGLPLANLRGEKKGVMILNYLGNHLLGDIKRILLNSPGVGMTVNREGYWLYSPDPADEWGFMFGDGLTFAKRYPLAWGLISDSEGGFVETEEGLFVHKTVFPVVEAAAFMDASRSVRWVDSNQYIYKWHVISMLDKTPPLGRPFWIGLFIYGATLVATLLFSLFLAGVGRKRRAGDLALRQSEERFRNLIEGSIQGIVIHRDYEILFINDEFVRMFGYDGQEEIFRIGSLLEFAAPEERRRLLRYGKLATVGKGSFRQMEFKGLHKDGSAIWLGCFVRGIMWDEGGAVQVTMADITERKQALEEIQTLNRELENRVLEGTKELRLTELGLRKAQQISHLGNWEWDLTTGKITWSDEIYRIFGFQLQEIEPTYDNFLKGVHPEDREMVSRALQKVLEMDHPYAIDHRIIRPDGTERTVHEQGEVTRDESGKPLRMLGTVLDITERENAEKALRESEEQVRLLLESTAEAVYGIDTNGLCTFVNPACLKLLRYESAEKLLGKNMHEMIHHSHEDKCPYPEEDCRIFQAFRKGQAVHVHDETFWRADGSGFNAECWSHPIIKGGEVIGAVVTFLDITKRVQSERELHEYREQLEHLVEARTNELMMANVKLKSQIKDIAAAEEALRESEKRFRSYAEVASDWFWEINAELRFTWVSDRIMDITGLPVESYLDNTMDELAVVADDVERWEEFLEKLRNQEPFREFVYWQKSLHGGQRLIIISGTPIFSEEGVFQGYRGIGTDATEKRMAEESLRESEIRLGNILETAAEGIISIDSQGNIELFNEAAEGIFGYKSSEVIGLNVNVLMPTPHKEKHAGYIEQYLRTRKPKIIGRTVEVEGKRKDGSTMPLSLSVGEVLLTNRAIFTGIVRDITEIKEVQTQLINAKIQSDAASQAKSEFLSNMSHELRTPLNAVMGYSQLLLREAGLSERQEKSLLTITESAQHLLGLINNILDLSKIEAGEMTLHEENFDLLATFRGLKDQFALRCREKGLELEFEVSPQLPQAVFGDQGRLRQVLINLLGNAIKFTKSGWVKLTVERRDEKINFSVADSGIGIPEGMLEVILEPFQQAHPSFTYGGTGLGMAISRRIVEGMGGTLTVKSEVEVGTTFDFTVSLPEVESSGVVQVLRGPLEEFLLEPGQDWTIMIVDDDPHHQDIVRQTLRGGGFMLMEAVNGQEAVEKFEISPPDLILMDIRMPVMDGYEATRRIKKKNPDIPVVAITSDALSPEQESILAAGCNDIIIKPHTDRQLFQTIAKYIPIRYFSKTLRPAESESMEAEVDLDVISKLIGKSEKEALRQGYSNGDWKLIRKIAQDLKKDENTELVQFGKKLQTITEDFKEEAMEEILGRL